MHRALVIATATSVLLAPALVGLAPPHAGATLAAAAHPVRSAQETIALGSFGRPAAGVRSMPAAASVRPAAPAPPGLTLRRDRTPAFSAVAVTWSAGANPADVTVSVRGRLAGGWSPWRSAETEREGTPAAGEATPGSDLVWVGPSTGVEVRVAAAGGRPAPRDLRLRLINPGTSAADAHPVPGPAPALLAAGTGTGRVNQPGIYSRAAWGADESIMAWPPDYAPTIKAGFIHHTVQSNSYSPGEVPAVIRADYFYHTITRGWGDIGYNFVVDMFGRVWQGRSGDISRPGIAAHTGGFNYDTFGIGMLGDFSNPGGVSVPAAVQSAIAGVFAWKLAAFRANPLGTTQLTSSGGGTSRYAAGVVVTKPVIMGHRDVGLTDCPGDFGYAVIPAIRAMVVARTPPLITVSTDFNADGHSDAAVFRPSTGQWFVHGQATTTYGRAGDVPLDGIFAAAGRTVPAVYRPSTGIWYLTGAPAVHYGVTADVPVPADYNGDGLAERAVFRPSTGQWFVLGSAPVVAFGGPGDVPVAADFTGDGRVDRAVFRPSTGVWYVTGLPAVQFGQAGDIPLARDFTGGGRADYAVFRPSTGQWFVLGMGSTVYGQAGDVPIAADVDGDGWADISVYRRSTGVWYTQGALPIRYGIAGDQPISAGPAS